MTDQDLLSELQNALYEPDDQGATFPSGLWSRAEVLAAMNERQNRFLKSTFTWVGIMNRTAVIGQRVYQLPQDWLTTVALTWYGSDGSKIALVRSDEFELDHALQTWVINTGRPKYYMDEDTPMLTFQVAPAPDIEGFFELLYIPQAAELTGDGEPFQVTDEYVHAVGKYGPLADLLGKEGRGKNPEKAAYAEMRYAMAEQMTAIIINGWA